MIDKKVQIEKLFYDIEVLKKNQNINIDENERFKCELKRIGLTSYQDFNKDVLSKHQRDLIKKLKDNKNIIIRKAMCS